MIDGEKIFKALKLGKVTGLGCTLTSAECDYLIANNDVLTQYINQLENPEPVLPACICEDNPQDDRAGLYIDPDCPVHGEVNNV